MTMLPAILAAAAALPQVVKIVEEISGAEKKAAAAAAVATDPAAPAAVKQAATNVASEQIEKKAALEKEVLVEASGANPEASGMSTSTTVLLGIAFALVLLKRR